MVQHVSFLLLKPYCLPYALQVFQNLQEPFSRLSLRKKSVSQPPMSVFCCWQGMWSWCLQKLLGWVCIWNLINPWVVLLVTISSVVILRNYLFSNHTLAIYHLYFLTYRCGDGTLGVPNQRGDNYECRNMKLLLKQQQRVKSFALIIYPCYCQCGCNSIEMINDLSIFYGHCSRQKNCKPFTGDSWV